ncbi:MAG: hypothetical protein AAF449_06725, partial [Myxococcota bacterium]
MRRDRLLLLFSWSATLMLACASETSTPPDSGFSPRDTGVDAGVEDVGPEDTGVVASCLFDKGGVVNRGCEPGFVCNLAMDPPTCVAGKSCATNADCQDCSDLQSPEDCGHGLFLTAWCDDTHGDVCVRSKVSCEPCETDADCGFTHPLTGSLPQTCETYANGDRFCARPSSSGCPAGFGANANGACVRANGCQTPPVLCPLNTDPEPDCQGTLQICAGEPCANDGTRCSTNDLPGALGVCIGFCQSDAECPQERPFCNINSGICIEGCTKDSCPDGQVCHLNGMCAAPCADNDACVSDTRYGPRSYCNTTPPQPEPRFFKDYHDANSCQRLGCEQPVDCGGAGRVCDSTNVPPACVPGCFGDSDCSPGELCKDAPQPVGRTYSRQECRAFPGVPEDNETLIGTCCNPGCLDRDLQCGLNEWCCGEPGSPYEDPTTCLTVTATRGPQAEAGECFPIISTISAAGRDQWCSTCTNFGVSGASAAEECSGAARAMVPGPDGTPGWTPGLNIDPNVNNGQPFRELEFCNAVADGLSFCGTSCNP